MQGLDLFLAAGNHIHQHPLGSVLCYLLLELVIINVQHFFNLEVFKVLLDEGFQLASNDFQGFSLDRCLNDANSTASLAKVVRRSTTFEGALKREGLSAWMNAWMFSVSEDSS